MSLRSKNKVLNIILSATIIFLIVLSAGGFVFGLLKSEFRVTMAGYSEDTSLQEMIKNTFDYFKYMKDASFDSPSAAAAVISQLFYYIFFIAGFFGCAISILINSIFLLVFSIQSFSKDVPSVRITRPLLSIATAIGLYVAILLGLVYNQAPSYEYVETIGIGPMIQIIIAAMYIIIASVIHIVVREDRKMVGRIFQVIITVIAFVTLVTLLMRPFEFGEGTSSSLLRLLCSIIGLSIASSSSDVAYATYMAVFGSALIIASFFTLAKLVCTPLGADEKGRRKNDYGKSSIVKSSLFLGFFTLGIVLIYFALQKLVGDPSMVKFSIFGYVTFAFIGTLLALSIVNKCIDKEVVVEEAPVVPQNEPQVAKEPQIENEPVEEEPQVMAEPEEEVIVEELDEKEPQVVEEPAEEPAEEPQIEEEPAQEEAPVEEPKEEVKQEAAAPATNFCPNCGAPVKGMKFCPNCGTKLQ